MKERTYLWQKHVHTHPRGVHRQASDMGWRAYGILKRHNLPLPGDKVVQSVRPAGPNTRLGHDASQKSNE